MPEPDTITDLWTPAVLAITLVCVMGEPLLTAGCHETAAAPFTGTTVTTVGAKGEPA